MTSPTSTTPRSSLHAPAPRLLGRFVWHELLARDPAAAVAFYPAVAGWTVSAIDFPGVDEPYTLFSDGEQPRCGIQPYPPELATSEQARWLPYIGTEDVDATCDEAISLHAELLMPATDVPTVGRMAVLRDPQGAQFAVFTPADPTLPEVVPGVGEFAWHEMMCADPDASLAFYCRLFGWDKQLAMDMGADGIYQMYGRGDLMYGGFYRHPDEGSATWNCYIRVADLDASCEALKRGGGTIVMGPHDVPGDDRVVVAIDNQGATVSLVSKSRP